MADAGRHTGRSDRLESRCRHQTSNMRTRGGEPLKPNLKSHNDHTLFTPVIRSLLGAVVRHLTTEGFPSVYNQPEDFYQVLKNGKLPVHDMIITNPPYSGDHIKRCLQFCVESQKPFCALLPNYVSTNDYYKAIMRKQDEMAPIFLVPLERYDYWMPEHAR